MHLQLKGKTALITGSITGIGKVVISLAAEGGNVILNGCH
ncbi:hypothetical protein J11TS1_12600 [Oceanobacillus sp. J11TS1]|nr:hypothetical protein J11TS1_12600 [Oceanobacillus sp. J11TS1]